MTVGVFPNKNLNSFSSFKTRATNNVTLRITKFGNTLYDLNCKYYSTIVYGDILSHYENIPYEARNYEIWGFIMAIYFNEWGGINTAVQYIGNGRYWWRRVNKEDWVETDKAWSSFSWGCVANHEMATWI